MKDIVRIMQAADQAAHWPLERKQAYVEWAEAVVAGLPYRPVVLLAQFSSAIAAAREAFGMAGVS